MTIKNIEIKCLVKELCKYRDILTKLGAISKGIDHQVDTYFNINQGRLKLRSGNVENSLIYYDRVETNGLKESNIELDRFSEKTNLKSVLKKALGINIEVDKKREIYFLKNVKINLDEVANLGYFVEIEAIDDKNEFSLDELNSQCRGLIKSFDLDEDNFLAFSYSDFFKIKENSFYSMIQKEASLFYSKIKKQAEEMINGRLMDHLCYRVETQEEYESIKKELGITGHCLIESKVGGRLISTYKLNVPLIIEDRVLYLIELPMPKTDSFYKTGFEHAEFVISESFEEFSCKFPAQYDWKGTNKNHNPELRLRLGNLSIKFHHTSLEEVIESEIP